jgi:cytoskeletal protein RodZ
MLKKFNLLLLTLLLFTGCSNGQENDVKTQTQSSDQIQSEDKTDISETSSQSENSSDEENSSPKEQTTADSPSKTPPPNDKGDSKWKPPGNTNEDTEKMTPSISYKQEGKNVHFTFNVKNNLEHLFTFHFETAQQYDYTINDRDGNVLRTYSKETKSPALPGEQPVKPGGSISYEVPVENLPPGSYVITFFLKAKEMQPKAALEFVVE